MMSDIANFLKVSEVTEYSYKLQEFAALVDDVRERSKDVSFLDPIEDEVSKALNSGQLNLFDTFVSCGLLGQLYTTKRCLTLPPEKAYYNHELVMREVYYYRTLLRLTKEVVDREVISLYNTARTSRYRAIVHLGGLYDHLGRFQEAQYLWLQAGCLNESDPLWRYNIGFSLARTPAYYEDRAEPFVLARAKVLLKKCLEKPEQYYSAVEIYDTIKQWKTPDISLDVSVEYDNTEEGKYNQWVNHNWLRLNAYNDINPNSVLSQDDSLFFKGVYSPKADPNFGYRMFTLLNEIKQEYVSARYLLYRYFQDSGSQHYSDKRVWLADNLDYVDYSYNLEIAKSAFRALYSILDKIAYALNEYLELGLNARSVNFKDVWFSEKKTRKLRKQVLDMESNYSLSGLLFIRNDIYGGDENYLQDEGTIRLQSIRNAMEHRSIAIVAEGEFDDSGLVLKVSRKDFEDIGLSLIRTIRQAIFCLVNMVNHNEYDKKLQIQEDGQVIIPQEVSVIRDEQKV